MGYLTLVWASTELESNDDVLKSAKSSVDQSCLLLFALENRSFHAYVYLQSELDWVSDLAVSCC